MISWSLAIEEFYYFFFPLFLLFFSRKSVLTSVIFFIFFLSIITIFSIDFLIHYFIRTGTLLRIDSIALGFLIHFFVNKIVFKKKYVFNFCKNVGNQTYSVYLFHLIILHFVMIFNNNILNNLFVYILIIAISSSLIYNFFEKPILKARPNFND